jgi:hypothetical protein
MRVRKDILIVIPIYEAILKSWDINQEGDQKNQSCRIISTTALKFNSSPPGYNHFSRGPLIKGNSKPLR